MGDKFDKLPITAEYERYNIARYQAHSVSICYVSSARAVAARYTTCDEDKLLKAYRTGSLHAIDSSTYYDYIGNGDNRGRAVRLVFNVDTIAAWARDDAALIAAVQQEKVARMNAQRAARINQSAATSYSPITVPSSGSIGF
ncbi:MAG: hypothetical protein HYY46_23130 [Deltaproteobacteria bacterium]|nr:hypothetical protein [Deltaproteobacteria bacterium]